MKRRHVLASVGGAVGATALAQADAPKPHVRWRMPSSFPRTLPTVFGGAASLAAYVSDLTGGQFVISTHAAGELLPALALLDAVETGTVECAHTTGAYFLGREPTLAFDTGIPFGMSPRQQSAWLLEGGGAAALQAVYDRFKVVSIPCGNTGAQMGGWFRKEILRPEDLKGLRIRAGGLLGHVYGKLGAVPQMFPASDVYAALEKGALDAAEWVGPYDDERLGFHKIARYYYAPGVLEPGASVNLFVGQASWEALPRTFQVALRLACAAASQEMLARYDHNNIAALKRMVGRGTKLSYWPRAVMDAMRQATEEVLREISAGNESFRLMHEGWSAYLAEQQTWARVNEASAAQYLAALTSRGKL